MRGNNKQKENKKECEITNRKGELSIPDASFAPTKSAETARNSLALHRCTHQNHGDTAPLEPTHACTLNHITHEFQPPT